MLHGTPAGAIASCAWRRDFSGGEGSAMSTAKLTAACCIAGGGPAGIMLGFLLARADVDVIVVEKPWETIDGGAGHTINTEIPPCPALSRLIYRILHASCYSEPFFDPNTGNIVRTPCGNGNNGRCEEAWRVCWELLPDGTPHLNETLVEIVNNGATCPATTNNVSGQPVPCLRICN